MKLTLLRRNSLEFLEEIKWGMRSMRNGVKHKKVLLEMFFCEVVNKNGIHSARLTSTKSICEILGPIYSFKKG